MSSVIATNDTVTITEAESSSAVHGLFASLAWMNSGTSVEDEHAADDQLVEDVGRRVGQVVDVRDVGEAERRGQHARPMRTPATAVPTAGAALSADLQDLFLDPSPVTRIAIRHRSIVGAGVRAQGGLPDVAVPPRAEGSMGFLDRQQRFEITHDASHIGVQFPDRLVVGLGDRRSSTAAPRPGACIQQDQSVIGS